MTTVSIDFLIKYLVAAQAAYGNVLLGSIGGVVGVKDSGFTELQKINFISNYSLVSGSGVDTSHGFQAVLFQPTSGGNKILAIRGSEDIVTDFIDADFLDIGFIEIANVANLNLHGGEGDDCIFDNDRGNCLYFGRIKKVFCESMNDDLYFLKCVV